MPKKPSSARRARPTALVRAEHHEPPIRLNAAERTVLSEAIQRGEDVADHVESEVISYGRWLLGTVFRDDARAALDQKTTNPVWLELVRRAGGPTLRLNRRILYVALALAAHDKRITDQAWRGLDAGRKELLLPLGEAQRLREAAQHVAKFNLTQASTRAYVTQLLHDSGRDRQVRVTAPILVARVRKLRASLDHAAVLRRLAEVGHGLEREQRDEVVAEIDQLRDLLAKVSRALRGRLTSGR